VFVGDSVISEEICVHGEGRAVLIGRYKAQLRAGDRLFIAKTEIAMICIPSTFLSPITLQPARAETGQLVLKRKEFSRFARV